MIGRVLARRAVAVAASAGVLAASAGVLAASAVARIHYVSGTFTERTHAVAFGQAPVFLPGGQVLFGQDFKQGAKNQIYLEKWAGGPPTCLTCSGDPIASDLNNVNGVPAVQPAPRATKPGNVWIIFHSWRGHYLKIGSPGYGGMGSALWAMRLADPAKQYQLTGAGANFSGEGFDDYHAYWSPDGTHIEYAHLNWNFVTGGGSGKWDVRVARFNVRPDGTPYLSNDHEVRPYNGHWYETQWWNPDPKTPGFLYTESFPETDGGSGAAVPQLFYCRLPSLDHGVCQPKRLTNNASWDEQAIFTPDAKHVLFMSSRAADGVFNTWANLTRTLGVPSDYDYLLILPIFEAGFLQPVGQEATDLYELPHPFTDPGQVRRLTLDGDHGWITPEFGWDPSNRCLVWTENRFPDGYRYQFPLRAWMQQAVSLLSHPPDPTNGVDVGQNGIGVAPLPLQQQTQIASFAGSGCRLR